MKSSKSHLLVQQHMGLMGHSWCCFRLPGAIKRQQLRDNCLCVYVQMLFQVLDNRPADQLELCGGTFRLFSTSDVHRIL